MEGSKKKLKERWFTDDFNYQLSQSISLFSSGKKIDESVGETWNGKLDYRGIDLTNKSFYKPVLIQNLTFENVDFSFADLNGIYLKNCILNNCVFSESNLSNTKFENTSITKAVFTSCNLSGSTWGVPNRKGPGMISETKFTDCNLTRLLFIYPAIKKTVFENCRFDESNFNGSQLYDCVFIGEIENAVFRGWFFGKNLQNALERFFLGTQRQKNIMEAVDFSNARFGFVQFLDSIDLATCIFPRQEDYIKMKNIKSVFENVKKRIQDNWDGSPRDFAIKYIDNLFLANKGDMQTDYVYAGYELEQLPADRKEIFWKMVREENVSN